MKYRVISRDYEPGVGWVRWEISEHRGLKKAQKALSEAQRGPKRRGLYIYAIQHQKIKGGPWADLQPEDLP